MLHGTIYNFTIYYLLFTMYNVQFAMWRILRSQIVNRQIVPPLSSFRKFEMRSTSFIPGAVSKRLLMSIPAK